VSWKFYEGTESVETAKKDLLLLKKRNELLFRDDPEDDGTIRACCVDNCCSVGGKLKKIAGPETLIKLDTFHWQQRWDDVLADENSEKTAIFRKLMRRALFLVEDKEIQRAEAFLVAKKKKKPSPRETFKEAKATMPPADVLERRVMAVLQALIEKDHQADRSRMAGEPTAGRFFKPGANTLNVMLNQMSHVKKGCLSDPPASVFPMFRENPKTGKTFAARFTGTNEVDNRCLNRLLDTPSVGLTRADRLIHNCCERSNDNKMVNRLGLDPSVTSRTEHHTMLHSLSSKCGFEDFPKKKPVCPRNIDALDERIGFDCHLPAAFTANEEGDVDEEDNDSETEDMIDFLNDIYLTVPVGGEASSGMDLSDEDLQPIDAFAFESTVRCKCVRAHCA